MISGWGFSAWFLAMVIFSAAAGWNLHACWQGWRRRRLHREPRCSFIQKI